jgi:carbon-monoxide dehydrogenase small subunit
MTLLTALREVLGLTAAKEGCGQGDCGSCIVLMNGEPVNSCLVLAAEADGQVITTLEGIAEGGELHPLQREFAARWAFQCGYCTPGMLMSCFALLSRNEHPTEADVAEAIEGNLCRCTNYRPIVEATLAAAATLRARPTNPNASGQH